MLRTRWYFRKQSAELMLCFLIAAVQFKHCAAETIWIQGSNPYDTKVVYLWPNQTSPVIKRDDSKSHLCMATRKTREAIINYVRSQAQESV